MARSRPAARALPLRVASALASLQIALAGCMHPDLAESERARVRSIALLSPETEPAVDLQPITSGRPEGALQGAVVGGLAGASALEGSSCEGAFCAGALVLAGVFVLFGAATGAAIGATVSPSTESVDLAQRTLDARLASVALQEQLYLFAGEQLADDPELVVVESGSADARFSLELRRVSVVGAWIDAPVALRLEVESRLDAADGETLISAGYVAHTPARNYVEWNRDGGEALARSIVAALEELAERAIDDAFRIAYASGSPSFGSAGFLLSPLHPPSHGCFFCREGRTLGNRAWERMSAHEAFSWQPFTERWSVTRDQPVFGSLEAVSYDFRIYRAAPASSEIWVADEIVYERTGLTEPNHRPDVALDRCTRHFWSVRARFRAGGRTRVSEWAGPHVDEYSAAVLRKPGPFWGALGSMGGRLAGQPPGAIMNLGHWGYPFISPPGPGASGCASILPEAP